MPSNGVIKETAKTKKNVKQLITITKQNQFLNKFKKTYNPNELWNTYNK